MKMPKIDYKNDCPIYAWGLFFIVFAFIAYIVGNWLLSGWKFRGVDGFAANTTYTYQPSTKAPNKKIQFGSVDLAVDVSFVCAFLKVDNALIKTDPSTNKFAPKSDYTVPPTKLQIYTMYNSVTSLNGSSASVYEAMDISFAHLFDANKLKTLRPQDISAQWMNVNAIQIDDGLYNTVDFFVIQTGDKNRQCASGPNAKASGLSTFFLHSIIENKSNTTVLQSLKYAYYAIVKPRFLANTLSNMYWQNVSTFTNADKGTNDSILYVLNTLCELVQNPTLAADLSANSAASVVGVENSPFPSTAPIQMYQTASVAYELCRFVNQFASSANPKIQTTASTFVSGYPQYLEKANQIVPVSPLLFLLQNPPDDTDCGSATYLQNGLSTLVY